MWDPGVLFTTRSLPHTVFRAYVFLQLLVDGALR